ncbi:HEPN domain-containing protein [Nodularia chucula]|uniref:HEPN domain-containing protein n=1 Tax=Nodularia chucula TaxID=3093667 RepID=UPI0039C66406
MNQSILAHRQKIDNLFEKVACFIEPEIKSEWSKYLCILVSGFIEESLRVLLEEYCKNKASPNIQKFVTKQIESITNCKTSRITEILGKFSPIWQSEFTNKIGNEIKDSIDSVVINRHQIAHGKSVGMSYHSVSNWYKNVKKAVEILEEVIK